MGRLAIALALACLALCGTSAYAQLGERPPAPKSMPQRQPEGPSLEETLLWISEKMADAYAVYPSFGQFTAYKTVLEHDGCKVSIVTRDWQNRPTHSTSALHGVTENNRCTDKFDLADIDDSRFRFWQYDTTPLDTGWLNIWAAGERNALENACHPSGWVKLTNRAGLIVPTNMAGRIQNALRHAIKLCQDRKVTEQDGAPSKRELF